MPVRRTAMMVRLLSCLCLPALAGFASPRAPGLYFHGTYGLGAYLFGGQHGSSFYRFQEGRIGVAGLRAPTHAAGGSRGVGGDLAILRLSEKECFSQDCRSNRGWKEEDPLWIPSAYLAWEWEQVGLMLGSGVVLGMTIGDLPIVFPRAALRFGDLSEAYLSFGLGGEGGLFAPGLISAGVGGSLLRTDCWAGTNLIPYSPGLALRVSRGFGRSRITLGGRWSRRTASHSDRGGGEDEPFTFTGSEYGLNVQLEWKAD